MYYIYELLQSAKAVDKTPVKSCDPEVYEKKIKLLEKQRKDVSLSLSLSLSLSRSLHSFLLLWSFQSVSLWLRLCFSQVLEVNKQWDVQWNNMKTQFEQKVCRFVWGFGFMDTLEVIS